MKILKPTTYQDCVNRLLFSPFEIIFKVLNSDIYFELMGVQLPSVKALIKQQFLYLVDHFFFVNYFVNELRKQVLLLLGEC